MVQVEAPVTLTRSNSPLTHPVFASKFPKAAAAFERQQSDSSTTFGRQTSNSSTLSEPPSEVLGGPSAVTGWLNYAAPTRIDHVAVLREAVEDEDWGKAFAEGRAQCHARASWSASSERCNLLQMLCGVHGAKRVLEIGSFCGAAALAIAEALPEDGTVVSLEFDRFFVEFGQHYRSRCPAGKKIDVQTGPALESLAILADDVKKGSCLPFDLVVIDADKSHMKTYFDFVFEHGLITERPVVCVDTTPFKGQIPLRYQRFGMADKMTPVDSGEGHIRAFVKAIMESEDMVAQQFGGMVVVQRPRN